MIDLTNQVYDYLYEYTGFEIDKVYQAYQASPNNLIAEVRLFHPSGADEYQDAIVQVIKGKARILQTDDSQESFTKMVVNLNIRERRGK